MTVTPRNLLFESLKNLYERLNKHLDVTEVFSMSGFEKMPNYQFCMNKIIKNKEGNKIIESISQNISMLQKLDTEFENERTKNVFDAIKEVQQNISKNNSYILDYSQDSIILLLQVASMLVLFSVCFKETRAISKLVNLDLNLLKENNNQTFYRGHTLASYQLMPSIYRNLKIDSPDIININKLESIYKESNLLSKYKQIFDNESVDYNFCAFVQHARGYSPFLDFTEDVKIALSFATRVTGLNDYISKAATIYSITFDKDVNICDSILLNDIDIVFIKNKLNPFSYIRDKMLYECTWEDFKVEAFILKDKTNDRMKYQKGCFLYFKKAVIINGIILAPANFARIRKYTIPANNSKITKQTIAKTIDEQYKWLKYDYLMNPYKYFEEAPL